MKRMDWTEIANGLRARRQDGDMRPADDFWDDFRARAALRPQHEPVQTPTLQLPRWAWAGACAALVVVAAAFPLFRAGRAHAGPSSIESFDVGVNHSAVLVLEDKPSQSIMLWVVDMETPESEVMRP